MHCYLPIYAAGISKSKIIAWIFFVYFWAEEWTSFFFLMRWLCTRLVCSLCRALKRRGGNFDFRKEEKFLFFPTCLLWYNTCNQTNLFNVRLTKKEENGGGAVIGSPNFETHGGYCSRVKYSSIEGLGEKGGGRISLIGERERERERVRCLLTIYIRLKNFS